MDSNHECALPSMSTKSSSSSSSCGIAELELPKACGFDVVDDDAVLPKKKLDVCMRVCVGEDGCFVDVFLVDFGADFADFASSTSEYTHVSQLHHGFPEDGSEVRIWCSELAHKDSRSWVAREFLVYLQDATVLLQLLVEAVIEDELRALVQRHGASQARKDARAHRSQQCDLRRVHSRIRPECVVEIVKTIAEKLAMGDAHCVSSEERHHVCESEPSTHECGKCRDYTLPRPWQIH